MSPSNLVPVSPPPLSPEPVAPDTLETKIAILLEARWWIVASVVCALLAGAAYVAVSHPIYKADALVQVEDKGETRRNAGVQDLTEMFAIKSPAETEIEILRSRSLLGSVVEGLRLDVVVEPRQFPIVGGAWARRHDAAEPVPAPLGLSRFAWGGERIQVTRLDVPAPGAASLELTALGGDRYEVRDLAGALLLEGSVGQPAAAAGGGLSLYVSELRARPGTRFRMVKVSVDDAVERLQRQLVIAEKGKATGIIRVELSGRDPQRISRVLDAIAAAYVRQNVERKSEEAEKTLAFITAQLPEQRAKLEAAEGALNRYKSEHGTVDVSLEASALIDRASELERTLSANQLDKADLRRRFTESHPIVAGVNERMRKLEAERGVLEERLRRVPGTELESVRLMRDVRVTNELYVLLLNKAQELRVVRSGTIGNVRILDRARIPVRPVRPLLGDILPLSLALGLFFGVTGAFVRKALHRGVSDPEEIEAATGIGVYAMIPHSRAEVQVGRRDTAHRPGPRVLASQDPTDVAVESVRSLRTSVQFALVDTAKKVIVVTGPSPDIGKSFVCANLAQVMADSAQRVLVIDGDLRKGSLHRKYGIAARTPGLSDAIAGTVTLEAAIRPEVAPNMDLLPTGTLPANPSELLMTARFGALMAELTRRYDLVVFDTPPCLAVTDACIIARHAGLVLVVLRAGRHSMREIVQGMRRLAQSGVQPRGVVFNDVIRVPRYGYGYGYSYQYEYKREAS